MPNEDREYVVSWPCLHRLRVGIQLADQGISVLFCSRSQMGDEGLDQFTAGATESFGTAEVCGIGLHEIRIEVVLADQKAELIPQAEAGRCPSRWRSEIRLNDEGVAEGLGELENAPKLLNRAEADPVGLAQGAIDRPCLSDAHLSSVDQGRDIGRIRVAVADESLGGNAFEDSGLENPTSGNDVRKTLLQRRLDSTATSPESQLQETGMRYVPSTIQEL